MGSDTRTGCMDPKAANQASGVSAPSSIQSITLTLPRKLERNCSSVSRSICSVAATISRTSLPVSRTVGLGDEVAGVGHWCTLFAAAIT